MEAPCFSHATIAGVLEPQNCKYNAPEQMAPTKSIMAGHVGCPHEHNGYDSYLLSGSSIRWQGIHIYGVSGPFVRMFFSGMICHELSLVSLLHMRPSQARWFRRFDSMYKLRVASGSLACPTSVRVRPVNAERWHLTNTISRWYLASYHARAER